MVQGRLRRDDGAGSVEYVGAILVAAVIVGSVLLQATPVGTALAARLCEAFDAECAAGSITLEPKPAPDEPCVQTSSSVEAGAGISIAFIDLDGGGTMAIDQMSDGTYRITLTGEEAVKAVLTAGEVNGSLTIMDYGTSAELSAEAAAGILGRAGAEFTFDDAQSAADFSAWVTGKAATVAGVLANPQVGIPLAVGSWIWNHLTGNAYHPPSPTAIYAEGGVIASASAHAGDLLSQAGAEIETTNVLGTKYDTVTHEATVYSKIALSGEAAVQLGLSTSDSAVGQGVSGQASVEMVVGVTLAEDGSITRVSVDGAATADGSYALTDLATGYPLQDTGGRGVLVAGSFPVDDANRDQVHQVLGGLGVLAVTAGSSAAQSAATAWIWQESMRSGDVVAQVLDVSSSTLLAGALALKAPAVGGLEFRLGVSSSSQDTLDAFYADGTGWRDWTSCLG